MMPRQKTFTVDAESVQGNEGASVTFRSLKIGYWRQYLKSEDITDAELLQTHIVKWNLVDDDGHEIPTPADEPEAISELYIHEQQRLVRLLMQGPDGESTKN
jgi:hypothetical protein